MTEQQGLLRQARMLCTEIGLQTYGRRGNELKPLQDYQKLAKAEALVRDIEKLIDKAIA